MKITLKIAEGNKTIESMLEGNDSVVEANAVILAWMQLIFDQFENLFNTDNGGEN
jgi:hypothetical protein